MAGMRKKPNPVTGKYQAWYSDWQGKRVFFVGTTDPKETLATARAFEDEHRLAKLGRIPAPKPSTKPRDFKTAAAEYVAWGRTAGRKDGHGWTTEHADKREERLKWWCEELNLRTVQDLIGIQARVEKTVRRLLLTLKPLTVRHYCDGLTAFCDWCFIRGYLEDDPLKRFKAPPKRAASRRRAMTVDEIRRLLQFCKPQRRVLYMLALGTGLRANELRNLTVGHVDLNRGGLTLDAAWTKNRKAGFQPLPASLRQELAGLVHDRPVNDPLVRVGAHAARDLDEDLVRADIDKETPEGKLDFHALRVAYTTLVLESGASPKEAMELVRHSTPDLTLNVYGRARNERLAAVAETVGAKALPGPASAPACAVIVQQPGGVRRGRSVSVKPQSASVVAAPESKMSDALPPLYPHVERSR